MKTMPTLPLREMKYAKTKLALLDALEELIGKKSFDEISVAEICQKAAVSYATFFNYFGKKSDLLVYFIQLWSIEVAWRAKIIEEKSGGLRAIEEIFDHTAHLCEKSSEIMGEIIALLARRGREELQIIALTEAEKRLRFPAIDDFSGLGEMGLDSVLPIYIRSAIKKREIPPGTDVDGLVLALSAIFLGTPVALRSDRGDVYRVAYRQLLQILWCGVKAQKKYMRKQIYE